MNKEGKTRHSQRVKKMQTGIGRASTARREALFQARVDLLESDFYETPQKLAEERDEDRQGKSKKKFRIKNKKEQAVRKKFNLKKLIKDLNLAEDQNPNFITVRSSSSKMPCRKVCKICGEGGKSRCCECYEPMCSLRCYKIHKQVRCGD